MGLFSNKQEVVAKKKPLFTAAQQEKARETRAANKEKAKAEAAELNDLRLYKENAEAEKRSVERKHKEEKEKLETKVSMLQEKIDVFEELDEKVKDLTKRELLVEKREGLVEAQKEAMDEFKDEIKKLKTEQEEMAEAKYKTGYADGLSDGIRKGTEYSAEDRKMLAQVAMLSAASHTPEAASTIAKEMAKNALPATTRAKNK